MFIALGKYRRLKEQERQERERALEEAREQGRREARKEARREADDMLMMLTAAARTNPELLPSLLQQYQERYQNGAAANGQNSGG